MTFTLPWLHPHRADVLAALALAVRQRQPLAQGFARLAEGDPLLRPWSDRLAPDLAGGTPIGTVLRRHRLLSKAAAVQLDNEPNQQAAFDRLAHDSLQPVRGVWLIRWFPVLLVVIILIPVAVLQLSGVTSMHAAIYRDFNLKLPLLTLVMLDQSIAGVILPLIGAALIWLLLATLGLFRGLRHLPHLWWVEVHRQAAMLELVDAAIAGADAPRRLRWPWSWCAALRLSAWRQNKPTWDRSWRTWRILTRWRALGHGWRTAARATTAVGLLQALELLPAHADRTSLEQLRATTRDRLAYALEPALVETRALLLIGFAVGLFMAVMALYLPLFSTISQLNGGW
ncbi:MAG: hypothetical protein AAB263_08720 [Planctomycetota bacterium]